MSVQLGILIVYVLMLFAVSWIANRIQNRERGGALGYLLAGRRLPSIMVATMLAGLAIGGASTVGVAQNAYTRGLSAGWYNAAWGFSGIIVGIFAARFLRRANVSTIPEMMGHMFGSGARIAGALAQLLILMVITSLQYVAGGAVLAALLPQIFTFHTGMVATAVIFVGIALIGGYLAGGLASVINVVVIYLGIGAALFTSVASSGGVDVIMAALPAEGPWFDWTSGMGMAVIAAWMTVMVTQSFSAQGVSQIAFSARDEDAAQRGFILGGVIIMPVGFLCALFGIIAAARFPGLENSAMALPRLATSITPWVGGVFLAALWAADISTAVGLLLGSSTLLVEDIWRRIFPGSLTERQEVWSSRLAVLAVSVLTYILAITSAGILRTLTAALAITVSFTLLILANILLPSLCRRSSGVWTITASIVVWAAWTFLPSIRVLPHIIYLEWPVCIAVFTASALFDRRPAGSLRRGPLPADEVVGAESFL